MDKQELIERYQAGERRFTGANLRGANLKGIQLAQVDLSEADLRDADLSLADLNRAKLQGANLTGARLQGANLESADLKVAVLDGADLSGANLRGVHFGRNASLRGTILLLTNLGAAKLLGADLTGSDLRKADLRRTNLQAANLRDANLCCALADKETDWKHANLTGANLEGVNLGRAFLFRTVMPHGRRKSRKTDLGAFTQLHSRSGADHQKPSHLNEAVPVNFPARDAEEALARLMSFQWPNRCVCCNQQSDRYITINGGAEIAGRRGSSALMEVRHRVPYCTDCLQHQIGWKEIPGIYNQVITPLIYLFIFASICPLLLEHNPLGGDISLSRFRSPADRRWTSGGCGHTQFF